MYLLLVFELIYFKIPNSTIEKSIKNAWNITGICITKIALKLPRFQIKITVIHHTFYRGLCIWHHSYSRSGIQCCKGLAGQYLQKLVGVSLILLVFDDFWAVFDQLFVPYFFSHTKKWMCLRYEHLGNWVC